jgi:hypothetical protein
MSSEPNDWSRPSVQAYLRAVLALSPADWERLDAVFRERTAARLLERARADGHPDPVHALPSSPPPPPAGWRRVASSVVRRGLTRVQDATLAPAWQRQGVGPARLLYERFQHPYVSLEARGVVEYGLLLLWRRPKSPTITKDWQRDLVRLLGTVVPWDAIWTTPDADGSVGQPVPERGAEGGTK